MAEKISTERPATVKKSLTEKYPPQPIVMVAVNLAGDERSVLSPIFSVVQGTGSPVPVRIFSQVAATLCLIAGGP